VDGIAKICFGQSHRSAFFDVVFGVRFGDDRDDRRPPATRHRLVRPSVAVGGRDDDDARLNHADAEEEVLWAFCLLAYKWSGLPSRLSLVLASIVDRPTVDHLLP
jgi:hypothetical protein